MMASQREQPDPADVLIQGDAASCLHPFFYLCCDLPWIPGYAAGSFGVRDNVRMVLWRYRHGKQDTESVELPVQSHGKHNKPGKTNSGPRIHDSEKEHLKNASR